MDKIGRLKINGDTFRVQFPQNGGKIKLARGICHFDLDKAESNDEVIVEFNKANQPIRATIKGKEAEPVVVKTHAPFPPDQKQETRKPPQIKPDPDRLAIAPYNFVPYEARGVIPAFHKADERGYWSGKIILRLTALTPLLIAGSREDKEICKFLQVNGHYVIPGTSIKGMLRSYLQIMSFSELMPISNKPYNICNKYRKSDEEWKAQYNNSAADLANRNVRLADRDFTSRLFGYVNGDKPYAGRISVEAAQITGKLRWAGGQVVVLGGPKPNSLPMYLEQPTAARKKGKERTKYMADYNDPYSRVRGWKLYWHHLADEELFPKRDSKEKDNVSSQVFPLDKGAIGTVVVNIDHLTDLELGGLLTALDLPAGHAHKLGMGKSLGFGSVRLEIEKAEVHDCRKCYQSLIERLSEPAANLAKDFREQLKQRFQEQVLAKIHEHFPAWKKYQSFQALPPIEALEIMTDYQFCPAPAAVKTMLLTAKGEVCFGNSPILPNPGNVPRDDSL